MKKSIVLLTAITLLFSCKSNYTKIGDKNANYIPYYLKVYEADSLYLTGNYTRSYKILHKLFKKYEPINMPLYFEYENYIKMAIYFNKKSENNIINLASNYNYDYSIFENDSLLNIGLKRNKITKVKIDEYHTYFERKIDTNYRNTLNLMNLEDQEIRNQKNSNSNSIKTIDFKNDSILKKYLVNKGFPILKVVGNWKKMNNESENKDVNLNVILIHLSNYNNWFNENEKQFLQFVKEGYLMPTIYAQMFDKNYKKNKNDSYYHFLFSNILFEEIDLELKKAINNRRKLIGLPSVDYQKIHYQKRIINN
ncbi:MAG: hypothetical protein ACOVMH_08575 [Flavobacterium sp.]